MILWSEARSPCSSRLEARLRRGPAEERNVAGRHANPDEDHREGPAPAGGAPGRTRVRPAGHRRGERSRLQLLRKLAGAVTTNLDFSGWANLAVPVSST